MKMNKVNLKIRFKNPAFITSLILSIIAPILAYIGLNFEDLTSWEALFYLLSEAIKNPYCLALVLLSVYNTIIDPTTKGVGDSDEVLEKK